MRDSPFLPERERLCQRINFKIVSTFHYHNCGILNGLAPLKPPEALPLLDNLASGLR